MTASCNYVSVTAKNINSVIFFEELHSVLRRYSDKEQLEICLNRIVRFEKKIRLNFSVHAFIYHIRFSTNCLKEIAWRQAFKTKHDSSSLRHYLRKSSTISAIIFIESVCKSIYLCACLSLLL